MKCIISLTLVDVLTFPTEVGRPGRLALARTPPPT